MKDTDFDLICVLCLKQRSRADFVICSQYFWSQEQGWHLQFENEDIKFSFSEKANCIWGHP